MATLREKAIAGLRRNAATKDAFDQLDPVPGISTGSLAVDILTGIGGFPRGRISEVFGWQYSGKTTLCVMACAALQAAGGKPVYIDNENGLDVAYAAKLGFDVQDDDRGLYVRPTTFEQTLAILEALVPTGESPLIIVDSIPAMIPEAELEGDIDKVVIGARARLLANTLPKLNKIIKDNGTALVFINQMRAKMVIGHVPPYMLRKEDTEQSSGGNALKFYSSLRIDMRITKQSAHKVKIRNLFTGKDEEVAVASTHEAKTIKNRCGVPYGKASFSIRFDEQASPPLYGIDNLATYVGVGVTLGIVDKTAGGVYRFAAGDAVLDVKGEDDFLLRLRETPAVASALVTRVEAEPQIATILARRG
jgi:recombination protein RecA